MTLTEADLAAIEQRADEATPGPWSAIQLAESHGAWYCYTGRWSYERVGGSTWWSREDAEFEAHARTDVPLLIAALRAAWARIADLQVVNDRWSELFEQQTGAWQGAVRALEAERDEFRAAFQALLETTRRDRAALREIRAVAESDARGWNDWARVAGVARAALAAPDASGQEEQV